MRPRSASPAAPFRTLILASLALPIWASSSSAAHAQPTAIFSDGFEAGSLCAWDNDPDSIDPASLVASSSTDGTPLTACLVASSPAQLLVWTDLRDFQGDPIPGAAVTIEGLPATPSTAQPGTYYRELVAGVKIGARPIAFEATACGETVALDATVTIDQVAPNATDGGLGGCVPSDGNIRVRVLAAETGQPISGASVLLGAGTGNPLEHGPDFRFGGASVPSSNVATTDASGEASFYDYGSQLADPVQLTAGADSRTYFTVVATASSDLVLPLTQIHPAPPSTSLYSNGGASSILLYGGCNDLDFALALPQLELDQLADLDLATLFTEKRCVDLGIAGSDAAPANMYLPAQAIGPLCLGAVTQAPWTLDLPNSPPLENLNLVSLSEPYPEMQQAGGNPAAILAAATYREIGFILEETVSVPVSGRTIDLDGNYPNSFVMSYSGQPPETDVVGVTAGDYAGTNGTDPLFLIATDIHGWTDPGSTVTVRNSPLDAAGAPTQERRLATIAASYLHPELHLPPVPPERRAARTTILIRGDANPPFGTTGGSTSVNRFLGLAAATFAAPGTFRWDDATANGNQPLFTLHHLAVRTDRHLPVLPCSSTNEVRPSATAQWVVAKPFGLECATQECFTLPVLPPGFPRATSGPGKKSGFEALVGSGAACTTTCDLAGEACVDPDGAGSAPLQCMGGSGTAEDPYFTQALEWRLQAYDLELSPTTFDFDRFRLADRLPYLTHLSSNRIPFD